MLKKFLILLILPIFLLGTASAQDQHTGIVITLHQSGDETVFPSDLFVTDDGVYIVSCFFPSCALFIPDEGNRELLRGIQLTDFPSFSMHHFPELLQKAFSDLNLKTEEGIFAGDLFEESHTMQSFICGLDDVIQYLSGLQSTSGNPEYPADPWLSDKLYRLSDRLDLTGTAAEFRLFDSGKYLSVTGRKDDKIIFTASFDFSVPERVKAVWGTSDNGKNFYWEVTETYVSESEVRISSRLLADSRKEGYRSVFSNEPVLFENYVLTLSESRTALVFTGEIIPQNELPAIVITGGLDADENPFFYATVRFGLEDSRLSVTAETDDRLPAVEGLKIIPVTELSETGSASFLLEEASDRFFSFYASLLRILPGEYLDKLADLY